MYINLQANRRCRRRRRRQCRRRKKKERIDERIREWRDDSHRKLSCVSKLTCVEVSRCIERERARIYIVSDLSCLADHVKVRDHLREENEYVCKRMENVKRLMRIVDNVQTLSRSDDEYRFPTVLSSSSKTLNRLTKEKEKRNGNERRLMMMLVVVLQGSERARVSERHATLEWKLTIEKKKTN